MHYYKFNIKDYSFATIRMSLMEDLAFRRMLDLFYESEKPLPFELPRVAKLIGMLDFQEEIRTVLNDFWSETDEGWVNDRALFEIKKYQARVEIARANGKKGGRPENPEETKSVNSENPEESELKTNHKPITTNHKPYNNICQQVADAWNEAFDNLPQVAKVSQKRKSHIMASVNEFKKDYGFDSAENWTSLFEHAKKSDFLMGRKTDWSMDFDFIINKNNLLKVIEGKYDNS